MDNLLFTFPGIRVLLPTKSKSTPSQEPGLLILLREDVLTSNGTDQFLRLQFFYGSEYPEIDVRLGAHQEASKLDPSTFSIASPIGPMKVIFPPVHTFVPQDDPRIDIPPSERASTTWQNVVDTFEVEIERWLTYRKDQNDKAAGSRSGYPGEKSGGSLARSMTTPVGGSGGGNSFAPYNPSTFSEKNGSGGRLVLIDEENGSEVGEVGGYQVRTIDVTPGSKDPVEIELPQNGEGHVTIRTAHYLEDAMHPAYANSTIVGTAATASRLIVTTSSYIAGALQSGANAYTKRAQPNAVPMTFDPNTHNRVRQIHNFSSGAAKLSAQTLGQVTKHAQNLGAKIAGKNQDRPSRAGNPGLLNKSLIAFSTIADGIDHASRSLLDAGANATTTVVGHKYGEEARSVAYDVTGSARNVGLVYVDASGVSRRAIVKGVAKGMVVGKVRGGGQVIVPGNNMKINEPPHGWVGNSMVGHHAGPPPIPGRNAPGPVGNVVGFGSSAPPSYGSVQGASAGGQGGNTYYTPPIGGMLSPQPTGSSAYGDMRAISPRPYEPADYRSPSPHPPPGEKSPAVNNIHGGYRY